MNRWRLTLKVAACVLVAAVVLFAFIPRSILPTLADPFLGPPIVDCDGVDLDVCEKAWHDVATGPDAPGLAGITRVTVEGAARDICPTVHIEWWGGSGRISVC